MFHEHVCFFFWNVILNNLFTDLHETAAVLSVLMYGKFKIFMLLKMIKGLLFQKKLIPKRCINILKKKLNQSIIMVYQKF